MDINVIINDLTRSVSRQGFGNVLLLDLYSSNAYKEYDISNGLTSVLADYSDTTAAYKSALAFSKQNPNPGKIAIAGVNFGTEKTDVGSTTLTLDSGLTYSLGQTNVLPGSLVNLSDDSVAIPDSDIETIDWAAGTITLKAAPTGDVTVDSFSHLSSAASISTALDAIVADNPEFYLVITDCLNGNYLVEKAVSDWVELNDRFYVSRTNVTDPVYPVDISLNERTATGYYATDEYIDAQIAALIAATVPGSATFKFKSLTGLTPSALTAAQLTNLNSNRIIAYIVKNGVAQTNEGYTRLLGSTIRFIDIVVGRDFMKAEIVTEISTLQVNTAKIPYDDTGIQQIASALTSALNTCHDNGIIASYLNGDPQFRVNVPLLSSISPADRAVRKLTGLSADVVEAGAIETIDPLTINIVTTL